MLRLSPTRGRNRISLSVATNGCERDTFRGGADATGVPHPLMRGGYCFARSSRVARRDGAPSWHGVSGRGVSEALLPIPSSTVGQRHLSSHSSDTSPLCTAPTFKVFVGALGLITSQEKPSSDNREWLFEVVMI